MNFEVPLVTDMTPVEPPAGAVGKRYNAITQGWQGNDDEHPEVSGGLQYTVTTVKRGLGVLGLQFVELLLSRC